MLFVQEVGQFGFNRFSPNHVAFLAQVQEVRHNFSSQHPILLQELGSDIQIVYVLAIIEFTENTIGTFIDLATFVFVISAARKDAQ